MALACCGAQSVEWESVRKEIETMPWVNEEMCVGCGICIEECPVDAISLKDSDTAAIDDNKCIRCGHCHEGDTEKQGLVARMIRHFKTEQQVAEMTMERLERGGDKS